VRRFTHSRRASLLPVISLALLLGGCSAAESGPAGAPYCLPADGEAARVWCESPMRKVFPSRQPPQARGEEVVLWAARGEAEPAQIVVRPARTIARARVRFEDLEGPANLRAEHLKANFVGFVNVNKARWGGDRTGPTPDPLLPNEPTTLEAGRSQPIWITMTVPREAPAGEYAGRLWIEGEGVSLPVALRAHVFDFALPESPSLTTLVRLWNTPRDQREAWWRNLAAHRITGETYPATLTVRFSGDEPALGFAHFDATTARYADEYGLRIAHVLQMSLGNGAGFLDKDRRWGGAPLFSAQFERRFTGYSRAMADHLREKGWLEWTHFQFWDEPKPGEMTEACQRLARLVRAAAPDAKIYLTSAPKPELYGLVDIWCVPLIHGYPAEACVERRKAGDEIWAYDNRLYSLDADRSSVDLRGYPWRLFGADVVGVEWWAVNKWTSDPYQVPNQYARQNGGGFFLYPGRGGAEPVNSIRWEMVREGIEDHDYLTVLASAIDEARDRLGVSGQALSGKAAPGRCARGSHPAWKPRRATRRCWPPRGCRSRGRSSSIAKAPTSSSRSRARAGRTASSGGRRRTRASASTATSCPWATTGVSRGPRRGARSGWIWRRRKRRSASP